MKEDFVIKITLTALELIALVIFLWNLVHLIFRIAREDFLEFSEIIFSQEMLLIVISVLLILAAPYLVSFALAQSKKGFSLYFQRKLKEDLLDIARDQREIDLDFLVSDYHLDMQEIESILEDFVVDGLLKGKIVREGSAVRFRIPETFEIKDPQAQKIEKFVKNIESYVHAYNRIPIPKIAASFDLDREVVEDFLRDLIENRKIIGYIDGNILIREMAPNIRAFSDLIQCPHCNDENLAASKFCAFCGEKIEDF